MSEPEKLVFMLMPSLINLLCWKEQEKGSPLTEEEVLDVRNNAICITLREEEAIKIAGKRGYDINPENCWEEWCLYKKDLVNSTK